MEVLPDYQLQGIGSQLVATGLQACSKTVYGVVVALEHLHCYPLALALRLRSIWHGMGT